MSAVQSQTNGVVAAPIKSSGSSSNSNNEMKREQGLPPNIELSPIPNGGDGSSSSSSLPGPSLPQNTGAHVVHDEEHQSMRGKILDTASTSSSSHETSATPKEQKQTQARQYTETLEERVQELEEKLATLSLLLQQQHLRPPGPPTHSPPRSPTVADDERTPRVITDDSFMRMMTASTTPSGLLDSPPPQRPSLKKHVRNLSYRVLHTEDFASKTPDRSPPPACSDDEAGLTPGSIGMTISEEAFLPTPENSNIFLPETLPQAVEEKPNENTATKVPTLALPQTTKSSEESLSNLENGNDSKSPTDPYKQSTDHLHGSPMSALDCSNPSQETTPAQKETPPIRKSSSLTSTGSRHDKSTKRPLPKRSNSSMSATAAFTSHGTKFFSSPSSSSNNNTTTIKSKWLDYLNSVQESHYDTDKQMEEFVKVPNAVEGLLAFGFWMCVDSFLYTLTILPIRFVWSSLLLMRFAFFRVFRKSAKGGPDGPFRFHRRYVGVFSCVQMIQTGRTDSHRSFFILSATLTSSFK